MFQSGLLHPCQPPCGKGFCSGLEPSWSWVQPHRGGVPMVPPPLPQPFSWGCTRIWPVGAILHRPCPAEVMACVPSPSCATLGKGAFWGEEVACWGEGEALQKAATHKWALMDIPWHRQNQGCFFRHPIYSALGVTL